MKLFRLLLMLVGALVAFQFLRPAGTQVDIGADGSFTYPGYQIRKLESFQLDGRVLSRQNYSSGRESELSELDLAMGWGAMQDPDVLSHIKVSQRNRWYFWSAKKLPIPRRNIELHSANIHIIAANDQVSRQLADVATDDQIRLQGDLVEVVAEDGWRWRSSLSRADTGQSACEVLLLHHLEWI